MCSVGVPSAASASAAATRPAMRGSRSRALGHRHAGADRRAERERDAAAADDAGRAQAGVRGQACDGDVTRRRLGLRRRPRRPEVRLANSRTIDAGAAQLA